MSGRRRATAYVEPRMLPRGCTTGSTGRHAGGGGLQPDLLRAAVSALRYYYDFERSGDLPRTAFTMQHERLAKRRGRADFLLLWRCNLHPCAN